MKGPGPDPMEENERELMAHYGWRGLMGRVRLRLFLVKNVVLQALAKRSPTPGLAIALQRLRGVRIGRHVYWGHGVEVDLLYPGLVTIEDYVSVGMHTLIFAHTNPTASWWLKHAHYPRLVAPVTVKRGAWITARCIILQGVTVGEHAVIGAQSVVTHDVPAWTVAAGAPATVRKHLEAAPVPPSDGPREARLAPHL